MVTKFFSHSPRLILGCVATAGICLLTFDLALAGTPMVQLVKDINPGMNGSDASGFVLLNDVAYFRADDGTHGYELWRSDGTTEGTQLVVDLNPGLPNG